MSHNAATVCVNDTLHVFGGQYRNYTLGKGATARGVFHASASANLSPGEALHWHSRVLLFEGWQHHCVERRQRFRGFCEFDGQFSAVYFRGRFLLYGRANLHREGGARHVQVTSAPADLSVWSPFQLVQIPGVAAGRSDSNIYFFNVQVFEDRLLALFPAVLGTAGVSGIFASTSHDGVEWTRPQQLLHAPAACHRTRMHPSRLVDGQLYVLHNIDISEPLDIHPGHTHARGATRPYLQRLKVEADEHTVLRDHSKLTKTYTFRVHHGTWQDVPVEGVGRHVTIHNESSLGPFIAARTPQPRDS